MLDDFPAPPETSYTVNYIDDCVADYLAPAFYVIAPIDDYSHNSSHSGCHSSFVRTSFNRLVLGRAK